MVTSITHAFHSDKVDGPDTTRVRPLDWNAGHVIVLNDDTENNVSTSKHGFAPKAPDDVGKFLRGDGAWAVPVAMFQYPTGRWFTVPNVGSMTDFTITANRLYTHPFIITQKQTADRIGVLVSGVIAGKKCRLGIYADSNGMPGALVVDAGEESVAVAGIYPVTIAQVLPPGRYWLAVVSEATPGLHAFYHYYGFMFMGVKDESPSMSSAAPQGVYVAHAYGALPDPFGTPTEMWGSFPAVFLRFSA
jgi:hypothetical protein